MGTDDDQPTEYILKLPLRYRATIGLIAFSSFLQLVLALAERCHR